MDKAFAWVQSLVEWFGRLIPRWHIVDTTHGWVKWVGGNRIKSGGAQIVWYWPCRTKFEEYPTARQTTPLPSQVVTTTDEKVVVVSGLLVYDIFDLEKVLAHTFDPEDTIKDIATSSLHDVCVKMSWEELRKGQGKTLDTKLRNEAKKALEDYGVRVIKFTLTTCAPTTVLREIRSNFMEGELRGAQTVEGML